MQHIIQALNVVENSLSKKSRKFQDAVREGLRLISEKTCLKFVKREKEADFIEFDFTKKTSRSHVGRIGGKQEIYLSKSVRDFKVVHEVMHALGFWHEHQRPDRDGHIEILEDNIFPQAKNQFDPLRPDQWEKSNLTYDVDSIMHYSSKAGAKTGRFSLKKLDGSKIPTNKVLSRGDIELLNTFYPCECSGNDRFPKCEFPADQKAPSRSCKKPDKQIKSGSKAPTPSGPQGPPRKERFPLSAPECYHPPGTPMTWKPRAPAIVKIVGGIESGADHPYMASIQLKGYNNHKCGGSIIHKRYILTAAHCFHERDAKSTPDPDNWEIYLGGMTIGGQRKLGQAGIPYGVETIKCHKDYKFRRQPERISVINDICLIKLDKDIEFNENVWPICLPDDLPLTQSATKSGKMCTVAGWGYTKADAGGVSNRLREVDVPLMPHQRCVDFYKEMYK